MAILTREDLFSLEDYALQRNEFRAAVLKHKKNRRIQIGPAANLYFEDRLTIQYQVQEMLRIEKIFEAAGIEEELQAYNPLIPTAGIGKRRLCWSILMSNSGVQCWRNSLTLNPECG